MSGEPQFEDRIEQPYVFIPARATLREWDRVNALVPEVLGWLERRGIAPGGPPFYRYHVIGGMDTEFEIEVGVPVDHAVSGDGRVVAGAAPAGRYAVLTHHGHPDRIDESVEVLEKWARDQGVAWAVHTVDGREVWDGRFVSYMTDPAVQPDPEQWLVQLAYLVADG